MKRALFAILGLTAAVLAADPQENGGAADAGDGPAVVVFKGAKSDPYLCVGKADEERCCGHAGQGECRGGDFLHPSMRPLAACLKEKLVLGGGQDKCPGGIGETFRTLSTQKSYKSLAPGWSLHNYGLALDACCYFRSHDCSPGNLINKAVGGIKTWSKGGKTRCQAVCRLDKKVSSKDVVESVTAQQDFRKVLDEQVKPCYEKAGITFARWNWGVGWKDYFDAPHFQYFPSPQAGYYVKKSQRKNGAHFFVRLLEDCYKGDRKKMLEELYAEPSPESFLRKNSEGCGKKAWSMHTEFMDSFKDGSATN
ncbi:MAG: M15 family metallopeptidase [Pseudomonadota bacterium]